jgi:Signal transduction histidine kinase
MPGVFTAAQISVRSTFPGCRRKPWRRAAVNSLLQRLDLAIELVRRFTADASHQMRTPLAILRTHLDLVRRLGSETPAGQSALNEVDNAINRLERLSGSSSPWPGPMNKTLRNRSSKTSI